MEQQPDPSVQRHRLRMELRRAREGSALTQQQAAKELKWSTSKLVRIEAGHSGISYTDLKALLELYGVRSSETLADLAELAEQSRRQPWNTYRDVLNAEFVVYLGYESVACTLRTFQRDAIHGLLQTEDYARSLIHAIAPPGTADDRTERQVEARMKRQQRLLNRENAPRMSFILDEAAVGRPPGSGEHARRVLRAQLQRLKEVARLPAVTVQILPISYGFHFGSRGPFTILEFPGEDGSVVYLEGARSSSVIQEESGKVMFYNDLFEQLTAAATDPDDLDRRLDALMP